MQAEALAECLQDPALRLFDTRFSLADAGAGRDAYESAHLPGARYADLNRDLADLSVQGAGRHPLPDPRRFAQRLGEWGVTPESQVVVYDAGDGGMAAARMWWLLTLVGHRKVAVLDGGFQRWHALGFALTTQEPEHAPAPPYPGCFDHARVATDDEVLARLAEAPGWLLDARAAPRFTGEVEPIDPIAGHVPGAVNRPYSGNLRDGMFKPAAELRRELEPLLQGRSPQDAVLMCGSGVTACHLLLAMEHAGLEGARVYANSWSGWIQDPARPIACGNR